MLGIVGSRILAGNRDAEILIAQAFDEHQPRWFTSGGADGIDLMSEDEADARGFGDRKSIYLPERRSWYYFKKRDKLIAEQSECLVCISGALATTHGAAWTADYAESIGRRVTRYVI